MSGRSQVVSGYPYPVFIDWDSDGLEDLMVPNETNRIVWYKNIGSTGYPEFGRLQFLEVDGYPDSAERRAESGRLADTPGIANSPYPYEDRPFFWRTGAAFADWNNDGLTDLITHHGKERKATLYVQYRDSSGIVRLREEARVLLEDGRHINDTLVKRSNHWTESFRAYDWDSDGPLDLVYSCAGSQGTITAGTSIFLFRNTGTREEPRFAPPRALMCYGEPIRVTNHGPNAWIADMNDDGYPDILTCVEHSVYPFFSYAAVEMKERPRYTMSPVWQYEGK